MRYIGLATQQRQNNIRSLVLVILFPVLLLVLCYLAMFILVYYTQENPSQKMVLHAFAGAAPYVIIFVAIWFFIAYFSNTMIINYATQAQPLTRKDNMRIYNLTENLCMSVGMPMPKINIIEDSALNAFASGLNDKTYTVTLTRGIINTLNDEELEGVIAHELSHIRNRDVRLLIISIVFVGIFAMIAQIGFRMALFSGGGRRDRNGNSNIIILVIVMVVAIVGYFVSVLMRFAISRKREYLADASAAEMTKNPHALASALRKISGNPTLQNEVPDSVSQLFIDHPEQKSALASLFATHPPITKRIQILEQF
ncbi:MAG: M48 family metallopeptidase [Bacteroidales bacterium]|jgi:heat shock protein HtpX|nr:M48 family metallopeptidase [Bacteroidales bacterium]